MPLRRKLPHVFLICSDPAFCEELRKSFSAQSDFVVCGTEKTGVKAIAKALELCPDLVIVETGARRMVDGLLIGEAIKTALPKVPLFLIAPKYSMQSEREALARGIDAVFAKETDLTSLVSNARAVVGT